MIVDAKLVCQATVGAALSLILGGASAIAISNTGEKPLANSQTEIASAEDTTAVIMNFGSPTGLRVKVDGDPATLEREINELADRDQRIADGGFLSVVDEASWASFSFRSLGGRYGGLFLKTDGKGAYKFRCSLDGDFVISWSPKSDGPCEDNNGKHVLKINRAGNLIGRFSDWERPIAIAKSMLDIGIKQIAQAASPFPDISDSIYRAEIERAYSLGFTAGDTPNADGVQLFRPDDPLSREEAVSFILEAIGVPESELNGRSSFPDVYDSDWSDGKIAYAERNNIVSGFQDGTFAPNTRRDPRGLVTRAQLMAMLQGVSGPPFFTGLTVSDTTTFSDTAGHWADSTIADMSSYCGVASTLNEQGSNFAPDLPATRAFTAAAIVRLHDCAQSTTIVETPPNPEEPLVENPPEQPVPNEPLSDELNLELGNELTLVRTGERGNANTFEVLQGSIRVTSEEFPEGKEVIRGQKITIVDGNIPAAEPETIDDFAVEATSCSILETLNPDYVLSQETPQDLRSEIMQQIERHKNSLGLPSTNRPANLSNLERQIIDEINLARENPSNYATLLIRHWQELQESGQDIILPNGMRLNPSDPRLITAYNETVEFLNSDNSQLQGLASSDGMSKAAEAWVNAQANNSQITVPNDTEARLRNYGTINCEGSDGVDENAFFARNLDPSDLVFDFIVGDFLTNTGTSDITERSSIFNRDYQAAGVACGPYYLQDETICSIIFAAGYREHDNLSVR